MTACAASTRRRPRTPSTSASRSPYSALRVPSSRAPQVPATRLPPPATAAASAYCDAPVNASRLSTQAWVTLSPAVTAAAPNARPDRPTASPRPMPSLRARRSAIASRGGASEAGAAGAGAPGADAGSAGAAVLERTLDRRARCMPPRLDSPASTVLNVLAPALVRGGRHTHDPLEVPGQVGLVGEANVRRGVGWRHAQAEQLTGPAHPVLIQVRVWRQASLRPKRPDQRIRADTHRAGERRQPWWIRKTAVQYLPCHPHGAVWCAPREPFGSMFGMTSQQCRHRAVQETGGGQLVAALGRTVRRGQQPAADRVADNRLREERSAPAGAELRGSTGHHLGRRVEPAVCPSLRHPGVARVNGVRVDQDDLAWPGPQRRAQLVDAGQAGVLPVPRDLTAHVADGSPALGPGQVALA